MDYNDPTRQQYTHNAYTAQQQQQQPHGSGQPSGQYTDPGSVERFRQSSFVQPSPSTIPSTGRAGSDAQAYGFAQSSQYGTGASASAQTLQYTPDLQSPDMPRQQDTQQFGQYGANVMYGMAGQSQQATQSSYDQVPRYTQQRPNTATETLASQFGGSQPAQYYLAGPAAPTSATVADLAASDLHSQYQTAYAQAGPSSSAYTTAMIDAAQPSAYSAFTQYTPHSTQSVDQAYANYQSQIRSIFTHVRDGSLNDVGRLLIEVSHYLLGNVETLGLTRDNDQQHEERIRLWDEFNRAWLAALQTHYDMTEDWFRTSQPVREPRSIMAQHVLETLSRELVRMCDSIEKHGLVDYQMGVAEEEIMDLLLRCLDQLDPGPVGPAEAGAESLQADVTRMQ